jgi:hypothetical protein
MVATFRLSTRRIAVAAAISSIFALGCGQGDQIQKYTVPKEQKASPIAKTEPAARGEPTDRMLTAILPANGQAWFFKTVGPIAEIDRREKEIADFFSGVTLTKDGKANWKLPEGWKEEPGNQFRAATIVLPGDKRLEITVNAASWPGTQESVLANINRWRGQLQLSPIDAKQIADVSREAKAGDRSITIIDMKGRFSGGMTPAFAGAFGPRATGQQPAGAKLPDGHPPIDASQPPLPAGHPPIDAAPPAANAAASSNLPKLTVPPSWKELPAQGFRKADYLLTDGNKEAHVTLTDFPADAGPMIADPLVNINRWRKEVGLSEIKKEELAGVTKEIKIDGEPAIFATMIPDSAKPEESKSSEATLAAIAKNGDVLWFIKLKGDRDIVTKHEDEFKKFLESIEFPRNETSHGNK